MDKITQTARYRQSLIYCAEKRGVTKAAIRCRTNRQYIYRRKGRYDGTPASLEDRSHRPHSHPGRHRLEEIKRIRPYIPRHNGKVERSHRKDNEEIPRLS